MNPGNGIETFTPYYMDEVFICFLFMNPGNGIETLIYQPEQLYYLVSYL